MSFYPWESKTPPTSGGVFTIRMDSRFIRAVWTNLIILVWIYLFSWLTLPTPLICFVTFGEPK
jgi:hypothetical protein